MKKILLPLLLTAVFAVSFASCCNKDKKECYDITIVSSLGTTVFPFWGTEAEAEAYFKSLTGVGNVGSSMKTVPLSESDCLAGRG